MSLGYSLYKVSTRSYFKLIHLISPFNKRANALMNGQKQSITIEPKTSNEIRLWLHVASLGEFEQAKPVLKLLKSQIPNLKIFTSFFSPSGYENRKNDLILDYAFYLPFERKKHINKTINMIDPDLVIWVKYDFWIDYLNEIHLRKIPLFLIAAQFNSKQYYFKYPGNFHLAIFKKFTKIFTQNQASTDLLKVHDIESICTGDPRYDNVFRIKNEKQEIEKLNSFWNGKPVIVCGSTYLIEEQMIAKIRAQFQNKYKFIIAPHFIDTDHIESISKLFPEAVKYSDINPNIENINSIDTIIIDNIGLLVYLYQKADIAIVGGGFKSGGLHNILEAAVHGIPVIFGPKIERFPEAIALISNHIGFKFSNAEELENIILELTDQRNHQIKENANQFILKNLGTSELICKNIQTYL